MTSIVLLLAVAVGLYTVPRLWRWYRERKRKREEGWKLVGWRRSGFGYELHFHNGTIVRENYYYPSGHYVGVHDSLWNRVNMIEKQLEFGRHRELELKPEDEAK